jgi:hypothetical protein
MTREVLIKRSALPPKLQNADCVIYVFGHPNSSDAISRVKHGGAYERVSLEEDLQDGDLVFVSQGPNIYHMAKVQDGRIVGKNNRSGDVEAGNLDDYRGFMRHVQIYRRNDVPFDILNDPYHINE